MYALNNETASSVVRAEQRSKFIDQKGAYIGVLTKAENIKAASGTSGIAFSFKGNDGEMANCSIYTVKADGTQLPDFGQVMSLMTCLGLRDIKPAKAKSSVWNPDTKQNEEKELVQFPELLNKQIGIMFIMEEWESDTGAGWSPRLSAVFRANDNLVASEILARKTQAIKFDQLLDSLKDRPMKKKADSGSLGSRRMSGNTGHPNAPGAGGFDDMPDDIPF